MSKRYARLDSFQIGMQDLIGIYFALIRQWQQHHCRSKRQDQHFHSTNPHINKLKLSNQLEENKTREKEKRTPAYQLSEFCHFLSLLLYFRVSL